jgi:hypothetical protein
MAERSGRNLGERFVLHSTPGRNVRSQPMTPVTAKKKEPSKEAEEKTTPLYGAFTPPKSALKVSKKEKEKEEEEEKEEENEVELKKPGYTMSELRGDVSPRATPLRPPATPSQPQGSSSILQDEEWETPSADIIRTQDEAVTSLILGSAVKAAAGRGDDFLQNPDADLDMLDQVAEAAVMGGHFPDKESYKTQLRAEYQAELKRRDEELIKGAMVKANAPKMRLPEGPGTYTTGGGKSLSLSLPSTSTTPKMSKKRTSETLSTVSKAVGGGGKENTPRYAALLERLKEGDVRDALNQVELLELFFLYPEGFIGKPPIVISGGTNESLNPQIGKEGASVTLSWWPQTTAPLTYPAGSPFAAQAGVSGIITDPTGAPLQLFGTITDEVTQQRQQEHKNQAGLPSSYRILSAQSSPDHAFPLNFIGATVTGPPPGYGSAPNVSTPWSPNCAVFDASVWSQATQVSSASAPSKFYALLNGNFPQALAAGISPWAPHGQVLPMGHSAKDNRLYCHLDGAAQSTLAPAATNGVVATNSLCYNYNAGTPLQGTPVLGAQAINSLTSFFVIFIGSQTVGTNDWLPGDQVTATMYGYNMGSKYQVATVNFQVPPNGTNSPSTPANPPTDIPIMYFPVGKTDEYSFDISISSTRTTPRVGSANGDFQENRNLRFGCCSAAGVIQHLMAPSGINSTDQSFTLLPVWSGTMVTSAAVSVDNWTAVLNLGGKCGFYQPPIGTKYQACGITSKNPYNWLKTKQKETDFEIKQGTYARLQIGAERMKLLPNISPPSTLVQAQDLLESQSLTYPQVTYELDNRNFGVLVLLSPGVTAAGQALEINWVTAWQGDTDLPVLTQLYPNTDPEVIDRASKNTAQMRQAYPLPDVEWFAASSGWRAKSQANLSFAKQGRYI